MAQAGTLGFDRRPAGGFAQIDPTLMAFSGHSRSVNTHLVEKSISEGGLNDGGGGGAVNRTNWFVPILKGDTADGMHTSRERGGVRGTCPLRSTAPQCIYIDALRGTTSPPPSLFIFQSWKPPQIPSRRAKRRFFSRHVFATCQTCASLRSKAAKRSSGVRFLACAAFVRRASGCGLHGVPRAGFLVPFASLVCKVVDLTR